MTNCCLVGCNDHVMDASEVGACRKHERMIVELLEEQSREYEMERWSDYHADVWAEIKGIRYAFTYNHHEKRIEMREKSVRGNVKVSFDDSWTLRDIRRLFTEI